MNFNLDNVGLFVLVADFAGGDGVLACSSEYFFWFDGEDVFGKNRHVGEFADLDGAQDIFLEGGIGSPDSEAL